MASCSPLTLATLSAREGGKGNRERGQGKGQPQKEAQTSRKVQTFLMHKVKLN